MIIPQNSKGSVALAQQFQFSIYIQENTERDLNKLSPFSPSDSLVHQWTLLHNEHLQTCEGPGHTDMWTPFSAFPNAERGKGEAQMYLIDQDCTCSRCAM
jgi:hypothetical protein